MQAAHLLCIYKNDLALFLFYEQSDYSYNPYAARLY